MVVGRASGGGKKRRRAGPSRNPRPASTTKSAAALFQDQELCLGWRRRNVQLECGAATALCGGVGRRGGDFGVVPSLTSLSASSSLCRLLVVAGSELASHVMSNFKPLLQPAQLHQRWTWLKPHSPSSVCRLRDPEAGTGCVACAHDNMFHDLNIPWTDATRELQRTVAFLDECEDDCCLHWNRRARLTDVVQ